MQAPLAGSAAAWQQMVGTRGLGDGLGVVGWAELGACAGGWERHRSLPGAGKMLVRAHHRTVLITLITLISLGTLHCFKALNSCSLISHVLYSYYL